MKPARQRISIVLFVLFCIAFYVFQIYISHLIGSELQRLSDLYNSRKYGIYLGFMIVGGIIPIGTFVISFLLNIVIGFILWLTGNSFGPFPLYSLLGDYVIDSLFVIDWEPLKRKQIKLDIKSEEAKEKGQLSLSD